jgi:hypothetical protein
MYSAGFSRVIPSCGVSEAWFRCLAFVMVFACIPVKLNAEIETRRPIDDGIALVPLFPSLPLDINGSPNLERQKALAAHFSSRQNQESHPGYNDQDRQSRKGLYLGAALAVVGGGLAWWSKKEADDAYDHYLHSASAQRQASQIDRAERFDRIAGGAFALMEAGVVLSVYFSFLDKR